MSLYHIERWAELAHDQLEADFEAGRISREEYILDAREIDREARDAIEAEIHERQQDIEEEYFGW